MRDECSITRPFETPLLPSYPLKVAFLYEVHHHPQLADWMYVRKYERVASILKRVEFGGRDSTLNDFFIQEDHVFQKSDRSYLEARRIKDKFHQLLKSIGLNSIVATWPLCYIFNLAVLSVLGSTGYYNIWQEQQALSHYANVASDNNTDNWNAINMQSDYGNVTRNESTCAPVVENT